jgi:Polyketide cyclase / dehydrase and lipid transport
MSANDYHFIDRWRVEGTVEEVADILEDALSLSAWWPSVYFEVKELESGGEVGVGKLINLRAGGWLPYTLRINFRTTESRYPYGFTMEATGDLEGKGVWTFEPEGQFVKVTYDWTIRANKPIIDKLSFLLKPIFRSNHNWTMKRGAESLKLELLRRRARTKEEAAAVPPPPRASLVVRLFGFDRRRQSGGKPSS